MNDIEQLKSLRDFLKEALPTSMDKDRAALDRIIAKHEKYFPYEPGELIECSGNKDFNGTRICSFVGMTPDGRYGIYDTGIGCSNSFRYARPLPKTKSIELPIDITNRAEKVVADYANNAPCIEAAINVCMDIIQQKAKVSE